MMMTWLIRTESGRRIHASEVRIIMERIRRQQTASTAATDGDVIQLVMFYVTPVLASYMAEVFPVEEAEIPPLFWTRGCARSSGPTFAVGARLVLVVRTGEFDVGRGRREDDEPSLGSAGRDPSASGGGGAS